MIYLDSAATSYYRPREVAQAVYDAILTMGNAGQRKPYIQSEQCPHDL